MKLTIPDSVTDIGKDAFAGCSSLTSITIPNSVTFIGSSAFSGCISLTIYCEKIAEPMDWRSDWNNSNCPVVWNCKNNETAEDGYIYTVIDNIRYALKDNTATVVRQSTAISNSITIPKTITYKNNDFSVTAIGQYSFYNRTFTSIIIPTSITEIGYEAFKNCNSLTIYCEAEVKPNDWRSDWNSSSCPVVWNCKNNEIAEDGYIYTVIDNIRYALKDNMATVVRQSAAISNNITIPKAITYKNNNYSVTTIGRAAFKNCKLFTSITLPDSITSIGMYAFQHCDSLKSIVISNSVTKINDYTFGYCKALKNITIPDSVTSIGYEAFNGCSSLKSIIIPQGVTSIDEFAFRDCNSLTIYCEATEQPSGWRLWWNYSNRPIVWGYKDN